MFDSGYKASQKREKSQVEVELYLDDGSQYLGKFGLGMSERLSDMMNDDRKFLPFATSNGHVIVIRKSTIARVVQLDQHIDPSKVADPFEILGVSREASDEELSQAYHRMSAGNHPDKIQLSGLAADFVDIANSRMARINDAYQRIRAMRRQAQAQAARPGAQAPAG